VNKVKEYIATLKTVTSTRANMPSLVLGSVHCNNAAEFLSHEMKDLLATEGVTQTTCPPHVHQLNGVAERAVCSIMDLVRVNLLASNAPLSFWPYAVAHAVDVLNRTSCPPESDVTCYETFYGIKLKIMGIMPFGCRAHVIKPKDYVKKSSIDPHAWSGSNLGLSISSRGSYHVWVPSTGRVHTTSDVVFTGRYFLHRPKGNQHVGPDIPTDASPDASQPPGLAPKAKKVKLRVGAPRRATSARRAVQPVGNGPCTCRRPRRQLRRRHAHGYSQETLQGQGGRFLLVVDRRADKA
jgi:hypothetical protein